MATTIYVLCRSEKPITYAELEDVMGHMGWLDQPAKFDPPLDERNGTDPSWRSFRVEYRSDQRPIVIRHSITKEEMEPAFSDIREKLEDVEPAAAAPIAAWLDATKRMVELEIPGDPPQDVWEMLDAAETFLARERDGIIVSDEGVFDGELNQILAFSDD
jgi:hypothetical protein